MHVTRRVVITQETRHKGRKGNGQKKKADESCVGRRKLRRSVGLERKGCEYTGTGGWDIGKDDGSANQVLWVKGRVLLGCGAGLPPGQGWSAWAGVLVGGGRGKAVAAGRQMLAHRPHDHANSKDSVYWYRNSLTFVLYFVSALFQNERKDLGTDP